MEKLVNLNNYVWQSISPYISGSDIFEIGAGVGIYTDFLLKAGKNVISIDIVPQVIAGLQRKFISRYPTFEALTLDISDDSITEKIKKKFDTVICLNVLEHVENDEKALFNIVNLLKPNGRLLLLVPALKFLYGSLDKNFNHYRRYTYREIKHKLNITGFFIEKHFYLHFMGIFGWFISSHITKNRVLNKRELEIYDRFIFLFRLIDKIMHRIIGQSLIVICKTRENQPVQKY